MPAALASGQHEERSAPPGRPPWRCGYAGRGRFRRRGACWFASAARDLRPREVASAGHRPKTIAWWRRPDATLKSRTGIFILITDSAGKESSGKHVRRSEPCHARPAVRRARSGDGDGERLGKQLTNHASAIGANGGAHGEFALALGAAGEEQNGDVATADQEQRGNGAEKKIERWAERSWRIPR